MTAARWDCISNSRYESVIIIYAKKDYENHPLYQIPEVYIEYHEEKKDKKKNHHKIM